MKKKNKVKFITDIICGAAVIGFFGTVAVINLFQTNRPTISESEKRTLAAMPEFSWQSLTDGSFFSDTARHISDTFIGRDTLVGYSKKLDSYTGVKMKLGDDEEFVLLSPTGDKTADEGDDELSSKLAEALDALNNPDDEPKQPTTPTPDDGKPKSEVLPNGNIREVIGSGENSGEISDLSLSLTETELSVGSGAAIDAEVEADGDGAVVLWSVSDKSVAELSLKNGGGVNVKALSSGTCTVTAQSGGCSVKCTVTVKSQQTQNPDAGAADFLTDGLFIYGDAVYTQGAYSATNAKNYADTALYYKNLFGDVTMSIVVAPVSSMVIDNPKITSQIPNQKAAMSNMAALCDPSVNFVDTYSEMYAHKDEYLFYKTDHHWTARGAYYAYAAYAKSIGFEPTPLDEFDYVLKNEYYQGSMYQYTQDERVKSMYDTVDAYISRKPHTMTLTTRQGTTENYNTSVVSFNNTYVAFIAGDNPYTHINVPDNPQDRNVLVLKDSFGNAFVPYLCEHFGNIYVVDTRYSDFDIKTKLADAGITDIVFVNNIQAANSPAWSRLYLAAVGVN